MVDVALSLGRLLAAFFLVFLNGFFVAAEFAYVRIRSTAVDQMVEEGKPGAETLQGTLQHLDDYLAVTQLGITIASLGLGWIGEPAVAELIHPVLESVLPESAVSLVAFAIGFGFITFLHVVFGELAPKTIAIAQAERIALFVAPPMKFFYYVFYPGLVVFNGTANAFTSLIGIPPASETEETLSEEEILMILTRSGTEGHVDKREVEMIEQVFDLDDVSVREVMVPRPDVVSASADATVADLRALVVEEGHTRYPVLDADDGDQVVGFVDVKDLIRVTESSDGEPTATAGDLVRDLPVIPETGQVDQLLRQFQDEQSQMAAVIDEWGSFEGIVTVEDLVEVVVGDIRDQFDVDAREPSIEGNGDGTYTVDGAVPIGKVNNELETAFETDEFGTIGGLVLDRLGRAPEVGDRVTADGHHLDVDAVDGARVARVRILPDESTADESEDRPEDGSGTLDDSEE
ncbi:Hemolysin, contains CBS domains [Halomicrobium zhouii]|uniref:Hemolysin, contains CBS domains n=1 Tax=Halomicrobium zhouii TaxID=767519 RepID=A0A1I6KZ09_9EURY|nr:hemolysin family protein [Halomicrobium zhouii]SFR96483.1 Hemolysin, contains CBS domains [Halomicrobium zhouii]